MNFSRVHFVTSAHSVRQLPDEQYPEIAFAGRSNVGKSSLINRLVNRKNLVKTSASPGKTRGLNFFLVDEACYLVDLPGYGFARVSKSMQEQWQHLVTGYLQRRRSLCLVVLLVDLRHALKASDRELLEWLRHHRIAVFFLYTKADKLSRNQQKKNAGALDAALGVSPEQRLVVSARSGMGVDSLRHRLAIEVDSW